MPGGLDRGLVAGEQTACPGTPYDWACTLQQGREEGLGLRNSLRDPLAPEAALGSSGCGSCVAAPCLGVLYSSELGLRGQEEGEGKEVKGEEKEAKR